MMALLFLTMLLAVILAWVGQRCAALYSFIGAFGLQIIWFCHHISTHLVLQL